MRNEAEDHESNVETRVGRATIAAMTQEWSILAYNENASVPFSGFRADWASRDYATGRTEFYKNGRFVGVLTLEPSQTSWLLR
jgi:hypothetical protein